MTTTINVASKIKNELKGKQPITCSVCKDPNFRLYVIGDSRNFKGYSILATCTCGDRTFLYDGHVDPDTAFRNAQKERKRRKQRGLPEDDRECEIVEGERAIRFASDMLKAAAKK